MVRSHGHRNEPHAPAEARRDGWQAVDLLAGVRAEMAVVRQRLLDLASPAIVPSWVEDPMPPQRLTQLKARITVVAGWGERSLAHS